MSNDNPKPCPYCGYELTIVGGVIDHGDPTVRFNVSCKCGLCGPTRIDEDSAIEEWGKIRFD